MFSNNLKKMREEKGISQKDLAIILNVSYKTISHYETGVSEPPIELIVQIKHYFNCDYEDLLE